METKGKVLIIYTGGTIGMYQDPKTGALVPIEFDKISKYLPVLEQHDLEIECIAFEKPIDSSDVNLDFWIKIASIIEENYERFDGFVILHGSDTMAYSASVLSFLLENLSKPVIFTGSQLPIGMFRTDARENIINSIEIAVAKKDGKAIVPEVAVFFENMLFRGNRVSKINAQHFQAFISGNYPPLAQVGVQINYNEPYIMKHTSKKLVVHKKLDNNVAILKLFPGIKKEVIESIFQNHSLRAVILETFGSGNAPTTKDFIETLKKAIERGIIIFNVTQCKGGFVEMGRYASSLELLKIGVISGRDITTESAIAKLMFLLPLNLPYQELKQMLETSLRGEMTT